MTSSERETVLGEAREIQARMTSLVALLERFTGELNEQAQIELERQEGENPGV